MTKRHEAIQVQRQDNGFYSVYEINGLYAKDLEECQAYMYVKGLLEEADHLEK